MLHIKAYVNILKKLQEDITLLCNGIQQLAVVQMQEVSMLQMKVYLQFLLALPYVICIQMCQYSTQMIMKIQYAL